MIGGWRRWKDVVELFDPEFLITHEILISVTPFVGTIIDGMNR